jgi:hypothetical protein
LFLSIKERGTLWKMPILPQPRFIRRSGLQVLFTSSEFTQERREIWGERKHTDVKYELAREANQSEGYFSHEKCFSLYMNILTQSPAAKMKKKCYSKDQ